ncbi:hypothetical protein ACFLXD_03240 [Chloroflexota bacterium]
MYAAGEQASELVGNPCNTHGTDALITGLEFPYHKDEKGLQEAAADKFDSIVNLRRENRAVRNIG